MFLISDSNYSVSDCITGRDAAVFAFIVGGNPAAFDHPAIRRTDFIF